MYLLPFPGDFHDERTSFLKCKGCLILEVLILSDLEKYYLLFARHEYLSVVKVKVKVNQSHYRPEVPRGFQELKVPKIRDNGPGW